MANNGVSRLIDSERRPSPVLSAMLTIILFATALFVVQRLTFTLRFPPFQRPTIWVTGALPFAALLLAPMRRWWIYYVAICFGAFAAYSGDIAIPVPTALLGAQFFFVGIALGAWGVRRFSTSPPFGSPAALLVFVASATVLVPVMIETPIGMIRFISGANDVMPVALRALLCDALGMLIVTPALTLTVANGRAWLRSASLLRCMEVFILAGALTAAVFFCFNVPAGTTAFPALLYLPLPLLLWAASRFELAGVSWALVALAFQSTWAALHGRGPFTNEAPAENVLQLQLFLLAISLPLMFLAAVIEERRRAFAALSESEQEVRRQYAQIATIYHRAPVGLDFVDAHLRYVSINEYLAEINGMPVDAHLGRTVRQVLPHIADTIEPLYRRVIDTGLPVVDFEVHGMTPSRPGIERSWLVSRYPVKNAQSAVLGVITVVQEITERKRAQEAQQELAHASRLALVGELTAAIAHEINQPLGAILSNADAAEMLLESLPTSLDEVRQILADIRNDDLRASEVIRRLRALLRKREIEMQSLDLNEVVSEVLYLVRAEAQRRGVTAETEFAKNLPFVHGDKVHVQQVLLNLFLNGMEAMVSLPAARKLTVRTVLNVDNFVEVSVTDAGPGIPSDRLQRLFEPFFSTKKEGMGLGLSIARSLVEAHGGRIMAENNPDGGATFRITLPTEVRQPISREPAATGVPQKVTA